MKTADLTGALLDYWTARAEGVPAADLEIRPVQRPDPRTPDTICVKKIGHLALVRIDYSTNPALWAPLIDKHCADITYETDGPKRIAWVGATHAKADAAPIAICRAVVRAAFGDEVEDLPCA